MDEPQPPFHAAVDMHSAGHLARGTCTATGSAVRSMLGRARDCQACKAAAGAGARTQDEAGGQVPHAVFGQHCAIAEHRQVGSVGTEVPGTCSNWQSALPLFSSQSSDMLIHGAPLTSCCSHAEKTHMHLGMQASRASAPFVDVGEQAAGSRRIVQGHGDGDLSAGTSCARQWLPSQS